MENKTNPSEELDPKGWSPLSDQVLVENASDGGWTVFRIRARNESQGVITLRVSQAIRSSDRLDESERYIAGLLLMGNRTLGIVSAPATGEQMVWVSAQARGVVVPEARWGRESAEGSSSGTLYLYLPDAISLAAGGAEAIEFSFVAITTARFGTSLHELEGANVRGVEVQVHRGGGARAVGLPELDASNGTRVWARVAVPPAPVGVEPQIGIDAQLRVTTGCGLTGFIVAPWHLAAHLVDASFANELGEEGTLQGAGFAGENVWVDEGGHIERPSAFLPFASRAEDWRFTVRAVASAGAWSNFGIVFAETSPQPGWAPGAC